VSKLLKKQLTEFAALPFSADVRASFEKIYRELVEIDGRLDAIEQQDEISRTTRKFLHGAGTNGAHARGLSGLEIGATRHE